MTTTATAWAVLWACAAAVGPVEADEARAGRYALLIQGFEDKGVFKEGAPVSYLSGVPEAAQVDVWDTALYRRKRFAHTGAGIDCDISDAHVRQGKRSLAATFRRADRALRISLRNNLNQPVRDGDRPDMNSIGWFDRLAGDVYNPARRAVKVELCMLGGFAVTDKARTFALTRPLTLKPGWNEVAVTAEEASAVFVDPYDATCVEFSTAEKVMLHFDNFRMERETLGPNLTKFGRCFDFGVRWINCPGFTYGSASR